MIEVKRIFNIVKNITVAQLPVKMKDDVILQAIDLGVIELYKRFNLSIKIENIQTTENINLYSIDSENITQILQIIDSNGNELKRIRFVNDKDADYKVISFRNIILLKPKNEVLTVIYKSSLPKQIESIDDKIDIPLDFINVLVDFVTYRCHITLNNDNLNEVDTHYKRFETSCLDLINSGYKQELFSAWKQGTII